MYSWFWCDTGTHHLLSLLYSFSALICSDQSMRPTWANWASAKFDNLSFHGKFKNISIPGPSKGCQMVPFQGVNSPSLIRYTWHPLVCLRRLFITPLQDVEKNHQPSWTHRMDGKSEAMMNRVHAAREQRTIDNNDVTEANRRIEGRAKLRSWRFRFRPRVF